MTKTEQIKTELLEIQKRSKDGMLHASAVLKWAKAHRNSALYSQIEWDADKAAREYQLWQVRRLIQIHIIAEGGEPVLVSLTLDRPRGGGYRMVDDVVADRKMSEIMLRDALQDLERVQSRYSHVKELTSVWAEVERVRVSRRAPNEERVSAA